MAKSKKKLIKPQTHPYNTRSQSKTIANGKSKDSTKIFIRSVKQNRRRSVKQRTKALQSVLTTGK